MAGRRARTDLHQLRRGAPLRRAGAVLAAPRPADRRARLPPCALHARGPRERRPDRRGEAGARPLKRSDWRALGPALLVGILLLGQAQALPAPEGAQPVSGSPPQRAAPVEP